MKPGETVRFACTDCHVVFDLTYLPASDWADGDLHDHEVDERPTVCPSCGGTIKVWQPTPDIIHRD